MYIASLEIKVLYTSSVPHTAGAFLKHEATRSIATPPGWDASPSQDTPSILSGYPDSLPVCWYINVPIHTPERERERHCES